MHELYEKKNADYGDSFAQMRQRYPNVIGMKLWEKVNRLCNLLDNPGTQQVTDEGVEDTLMDIANYCIMELTERKATSQGGMGGTGGPGRVTIHYDFDVSGGV